MPWISFPREIKYQKYAARKFCWSPSGFNFLAQRMPCNQFYIIGFLGELTYWWNLMWKGFSITLQVINLQHVWTTSILRFSGRAEEWGTLSLTKTLKWITAAALHLISEVYIKGNKRKFASFRVPKKSSSGKMSEQKWEGRRRRKKKRRVV